MTKEEFNNIVVEAELEFVKELLEVKNGEYADGNTDAFINFRRAAAYQGVSPQKALMGMLSKHLVSIETMCEGVNHYPMEQWTEKITDTICYMLLLLGIAKEQDDETKNKTVVKNWDGIEVFEVEGDCPWK